MADLATFNKQILATLKSDITNAFEDFNQRLDTLIQMAENTSVCSQCKSQIEDKSKKYIKIGNKTLCATDGSLRIFDGFKRSAFAVAFGPEHPKNIAVISERIPVIFIAELEGIDAALDIGELNNLFPMIILVDNIAALTLAQEILQGRDDFLEMAKQRSNVAELLKSIAKHKEKDITLQHIYSHTGMASSHFLLNTIADKNCNKVLEVTFETQHSDNSQVSLEELSTIKCH